jgi:hypothetical protein
MLLQARERDLRGHLLIHSTTHPDEMGLRDWLDAGERFMLEPVEDVLTRDILSRLFEVESEQAMADTFDELRALSASIAADIAKAEAKERERRHVMRKVTADEMADAAAEWGMELPDGWGEAVESPESDQDPM